jgi:DNA-binding transcriptional ArsR family regulator
MLTKKQAKSLKNDVDQGSEELAKMLNGLSDPGRLKVFRLLAMDGDLCVTDLANILETSVPATSQQLRILETSGLVRKERRGRMTCYTLIKNVPLVRTLRRMVV